MLWWFLCRSVAADIDVMASNTRYNIICCVFCHLRLLSFACCTWAKFPIHVWWSVVCSREPDILCAKKCKLVVFSGKAIRRYLHSVSHHWTVGSKSIWYRQPKYIACFVFVGAMAEGKTGRQLLEELAVVPSPALTLHEIKCRLKTEFPFLRNHQGLFVHWTILKEVGSWESRC